MTAIGNLIDNAVKHGASAHLALSSLDSRARIVIRDEGPGIPFGKIDIAFAPFRRLEESRNRNTGGDGLGLTIARDAILAHGGRITTQQLVPAGFEVTVTLPSSLPALD